MKRFTPEFISALGEKEVFVFGSNLAGHHSGGAARVAYDRFGAAWGVGVGMRGQSYAIPTMHGGIDAIEPYVDQFTAFAESHSELTFLVTRIGCGIAGFNDEEIAPLFREASKLRNVVLPKTFQDVIDRQDTDTKRSPLLMGAILGDIAGSIYEFSPCKSVGIGLQNRFMDYTDDTVMTIAIADWLLNDAQHTKAELVRRMQYWGRKYPNPLGSYGGMFKQWLCSNHPQPYGSWGNGSAMRVSAIGYAFDTLEETLKVAKISAEVTHNHPEGIKGAQATAAAIFLARNGYDKEYIRDFIQMNFAYYMELSCDEIRPYYRFDDSCQGTVPESIIAFIDSESYEEALRLTISLGGDADTMGAITGAIAGAYYNEVPESLYRFGMGKLPDDMRKVVMDFDLRYGSVMENAPDHIHK